MGNRRPINGVVLVESRGADEVKRNALPLELEGEVGILAAVAGVALVEATYFREN